MNVIPRSSTSHLSFLYLISSQMPSHSQGTCDLPNKFLSSSTTSSASLPSHFSTASSATHLSRQFVETWLERVTAAGVKRKRCSFEEAENPSDTLSHIGSAGGDLEGMAGQSPPNKRQVSSLSRPAASPSLLDKWTRRLTVCLFPRCHRPP